VKCFSLSHILYNICCHWFDIKVFNNFCKVPKKLKKRKTTHCKSQTSWTWEKIRSSVENKLSLLEKNNYIQQIFSYYFSTCTYIQWYSRYVLLTKRMNFAFLINKQKTLMSIFQAKQEKWVASVRVSQWKKMIFCVYCFFSKMFENQVKNLVYKCQHFDDKWFGISNTCDACSKTANFKEEVAKIGSITTEKPMHVILIFCMALGVTHAHFYLWTKDDNLFTESMMELIRLCIASDPFERTIRTEVVVEILPVSAMSSNHVFTQSDSSLNGIKIP